MNIPGTIRAGATVKWKDSSTTDPFDETISAPDWTLKYYLRTNAAANGFHTATAVQDSTSTGWKTTISATDTASFTVGDWYWTDEFSKGAEKFTRSGQLEVLQSLVYAGGNPGAIDNRSQAKKDLDAVTTAIRVLTTDAGQEYSIGGRTYKKVNLPDLIARESQLKFIVNKEDQANLIANGKGNPFTMYARF